MSALTVLVLLTVSTARGIDFRVENQVYLGSEKTPQVQSTTIFLDGVVYDYLENPREITVFHEARGRFIFLDPVRRVRSELSTEDLESLVRRLKDWAGNQPDKFLRFLAAPEFEASVDEKTGDRVFQSTWLTYRVSTVQTADAKIAHQYASFSDWYGRLNTRINPGSRPPFARMLVNAELDREQLFPERVHLTLRPKGNAVLSKKITLRSEHKLVRQLVESDRRRVAQTDQYMAIFKPVAFEEYQAGIHQE